MYNENYQLEKDNNCKKYTTMTDNKFQKQLDKIEEKYLQIKLENLADESMLDMMLHQYRRFFSAGNYINRFAAWQKWIRA